MRQITVDFTSQTYPLFAGYLGEHNATELIAVKPVDMSGAMYSLAFMTNGEVIHSKYFSADEDIKVTLWQQLTQDNTLYVQLEAYDSNREYLGKSTMAKLILSNSVHGMDIIADSDNPDVYSEIAQNSAFREKLEDNADTLDKLTTSDTGKLLFDGRPVDGSGGGTVGDLYAEDIYYYNSDLADTSNTVKGALDEAIDFVVHKIPEIYVNNEKLDNAVNSALEEAKASGDFKGDKGDKGNDGYTPQKGVDYFDGNDYVLTEADKTEIANAVLDSLQTAEGGLY